MFGKKKETVQKEEKTASTIEIAEDGIRKITYVNFAPLTEANKLKVVEINASESLMHLGLGISDERALVIGKCCYKHFTSSKNIVEVLEKVTSEEGENQLLHANELVMAVLIVKGILDKQNKPSPQEFIDFLKDKFKDNE